MSVRIYSFLYIFLHKQGVFVWFNSFVIQENPEFNQFSVKPGSGNEGGVGWGVVVFGVKMSCSGKCGKVRTPPPQHVGPRPRQKSATKFVELTMRLRPAGFWCDTHKHIVFN